MKVLYDHQIFTMQKYGGVSRYFYELIKQFSHINNMNIETSLFWSNNHYISNKKHIKHIQCFPDKNIPGKVKLLTLINKYMTIRQLKNQNYDIFHPTYYNPYFLQYIGKKQFVVTVYDMLHEKFPSMFPNDQTSDFKRMLIKRASKIIAISENTKLDIISLLGVNTEKITVIPLANSLTTLPTCPAIEDLPQKYILFIGNRKSYKNFNRFIQAISKLLIVDPSLSVVCVGDSPFRNEEEHLLSQLKITNQVFHHNADDAKLAQYYKQAKAFVYPSLYEGFGIPLLEAFHCKCPVICSNTGSFPEVAGSAATYFNPMDEISIQDAISKILNNSNLCQTQIKLGLDRSQHFSWKNTAMLTQKFYRSIL